MPLQLTKLLVMQSETPMIENSNKDLTLDATKNEMKNPKKVPLALITLIEEIIAKYIALKQKEEAQQPLSDQDYEAIEALELKWWKRYNQENSDQRLIKEKNSVNKSGGLLLMIIFIGTYMWYRRRKAFKLEVNQDGGELPLRIDANKKEKAEESPPHKKPEADPAKKKQVDDANNEPETYIDKETSTLKRAKKKLMMRLRLFLKYLFSSLL